MTATNNTEFHALNVVDIPLVLRLIEDGIVLDSKLGFTDDADGPSSHVFATIFLPQRGLHTVVLRHGDQKAVGQFQLRPDDANARVAYIAPSQTDDGTDTVWLHIFDAMAAEAGRRGAHVLTAEVAEDSHLFESMRRSNFAVYARQTIWQRLPRLGTPQTRADVMLTRETDADWLGLQALFADTVPRLVQQVFTLRHSGGAGLVYRKEGRVEGYVWVCRGKHGIYMLPYLHPNIYNDAAAVIAAAIARVKRTDRLPVYLRVCRYQSWLEEVIMPMGFQSVSEQAVMVRHITAGVRHATFKPLEREIEALPSPVRPPTSRICKHTIRKHEQEQLY